MASHLHTFTPSHLHSLVAHFVASRWPIAVALNKADAPSAAARIEGTLIACGWPALHASAHHSAPPRGSKALEDAYRIVGWCPPRRVQSCSRLHAVRRRVAIGPLGRRRRSWPCSRGAYLGTYLGLLGRRRRSWPCSRGAYLGTYLGLLGRRRRSWPCSRGVPLQGKGVVRRRQHWQLGLRRYRARRPRYRARRPRYSAFVAWYSADERDCPLIASIIRSVRRMVQHSGAALASSIARPHL